MVVADRLPAGADACLETSDALLQHYGMPL